jgi:hypothetical protein
VPILRRSIVTSSRRADTGARPGCRVYVVTHRHVINPVRPHVDDKLIGFYVTREQADQAVGATSGLPGFVDELAGYRVVEMVLDAPHDGPPVRLYG